MQIHLETGGKEQSKKVTKDSSSTVSEVKMLVVWLESFEDYYHFPVGKHVLLYYL